NSSDSGRMTQNGLPDGSSSTHQRLMRYLRRAPADSSRSTSASRRSLSMSRWRSEEHTSELQSRENLVCRLLLEKKKSTKSAHRTSVSCYPAERSMARSARHVQSASLANWAYSVHLTTNTSSDPHTTTRPAR